MSVGTISSKSWSWSWSWPSSASGTSRRIGKHRNLGSRRRRAPGNSGSFGPPGLRESRGTSGYRAICGASGGSLTSPETPGSWAMPTNRGLDNYFAEAGVDTQNKFSLG
jgi:hypothetical protein